MFYRFVSRYHHMKFGASVDKNVRIKPLRMVVFLCSVVSDLKTVSSILFAFFMYTSKLLRGQYRLWKESKLTILFKHKNTLREIQAYRVQKSRRKMKAFYWLYVSKDCLV